MDLYLVQILGLYLVIVGTIVLISNKSLLPAVRDIGKNRGLLLVIGAFEIIAGLAIVLAYPVVSLTVSGIVSLVGYVMVLEGILYFAAPTKLVKKLFTAFNKPQWFLVGGLLSILAGLYLSAIGFGFWI